MKKFTTSLAVVGLMLTALQSSAQQNVGIGTITPDPSARLDINANNKGLLIPKVALTSLTDVTTVATPANGLLVFNTNAALAGGTGFFYNSGTTAAASWVRLQTGAGGGGAGWSLTGNTGTDSLLNFIGTTDVKPLTFRVANGYAGAISPTGSIAIGRAAVGTERTPSPNIIAIGDSALFNNAGDFSEIAIGNGALFNNNVPGDGDNVAIGHLTQVLGTQNFRNVSVGNLTLALSDSSFSNVAVGFRASFGTQGEENVAIGAQSMDNDQVGFNNTAVGFATLNSNGNGFYNVAVGSEALISNFEGNRNVAVGRAALASDSNGIRNTALGYFSAISTITGNKNIAIGPYALRTNLAGSFNIAIGDSADVVSGTTVLSNAIAIGTNSISNANNRVVVGNVAHTSIGGQVGWTTFSDGRYKKDVQENVSGLNFIMKLRPVTYFYDFDKINSELYNRGSFANNAVLSRSAVGKSVSLNKAGAAANPAGAKHAANRFVVDDNAKGKGSNPYFGIQNQNEGVRFTGFLAQEVEAAAKTAGFDFSGVDKPTNDKANYGLRYAEFVVPLVKAVQEQQAVIEAQNKMISDLTKRLEALENK